MVCPVVGLCVPYDATAACVSVVLQRDLGDDLAVDLLEWGVGEAPACAAVTEDFVQALDDVGGFDRYELEAAAGISAQRFGWERCLYCLDLFCAKHICLLLAGRKKAPSTCAQGATRKTVTLVTPVTLTQAQVMARKKDSRRPSFFLLLKNVEYFQWR